MSLSDLRDGPWGGSGLQGRRPPAHRAPSTAAEPGAHPQSCPATLPPAHSSVCLLSHWASLRLLSLQHSAWPHPSNEKKDMSLTTQTPTPSRTCCPRVQMLRKQNWCLWTSLDPPAKWLFPGVVSCILPPFVPEPPAQQSTFIFSSHRPLFSSPENVRGGGKLRQVGLGPKVHEDRGGIPSQPTPPCLH